mgnify:CR=1 FL=1
MPHRDKPVKSTWPAMGGWIKLCLLWATAGAVGSALARETIYRCGQEYTNTPKDLTRCEPLAEQNVSVITGLRPHPPGPTATTPEAATTKDSRGKLESARPGATLQTERDVQARAILLQELERAQKQRLDLMQEFNQGAPVKLPTETIHPSQYQDRVSGLKAAIARAERDIDSLQRELARRPLASQGSTP